MIRDRYRPIPRIAGRALPDALPRIAGRALPDALPRIAGSALPDALPRIACRALLCAFPLIAALLFFAAPAARADVVGRLHFSVENAGDEKPLPKAVIVLKDSAKVRADVILTTDEKGTVTSPPMDTRAWQAVTDAADKDAYETDTRNVTVVADTTTEVEVLLEPRKEKVKRISANKSLVNKNNSTTTTDRDSTFISEFPAGSNAQSLQRLLITAPGFVEDSVQQAHPRGEHSSTTIFIDGFELPDVLIGRAGALLLPDSMQDLSIMTGAYPPEYGGETAAILNVTLKSGPITPFASAYAEGGSYNTFDGSLVFGGQGGRAIGKPGASGNTPRAFGYFVDINARSTDNALESPQPDDQTAHNHGESQAYFGHFNYQASSKDELTLTVNTSPATTDVANRAGLSSFYIPYGQGYGFGGVRNQNGGIPLAAAVNPGGLGDGTIPLGSQEADGQGDYQRDVNDLGVLNWRHTLSPQLTSLFSVAMIHSGQSILNNNPGVGGGTGVNFNALDPNLPLDNSIEFNPTIVRNYHHVQTQGSMTYTAGAHTVKGGLLYDNEEGNESYQLVPGSQLALDSLAALDPSLAPAGTVQMTSSSSLLKSKMSKQAVPVLDVNGNPVYIESPGAASPTLNVSRSGFYAAGYLQDTWAVTKRFTANYGVRLDWYQASQNVAGQTAVNDLTASPRFNMSYLVATKTIARFAYNRLFIQPPLAQGEIIGQAIQPEITNQLDLSIERQVAKNQTAKIALYSKSSVNQIDTGLLVPNSQIGAYTSVNFAHSNVKGEEISWNLVPRNNVGIGAYLSYANSLAKPYGEIDGEPGTSAPTYNDHDQLNTISTGISYAWRSGANTALDLYYGSGNGSSGLVAANNDTSANNTGPRTPHSRVNLLFSSGPKLFGGSKNPHGGVSLIIENVFDDRSIINFNSGFSGTRFDQGRTILLQAFGKF